MKFIGIDLAWTYKNESGICVMDDNGAVLLLESAVFSDEDIVNVIKKYSDEQMHIAIDAPLVVNNENGSREAERELHKGRINGHRVYAFNSNRTFLTKTFKSIRGEVLSQLIIEHIPNISIGFNDKSSSIIETFPTGICIGLFPEIYPVKYKRKKGMTFEQSIEQMYRLVEKIELLENRNIIQGFSNRFELDSEAVTRKLYKHLEDKIDAVLCALALYMLNKELAVPRKFGSDEDGFILIPELNRG